MRGCHTGSKVPILGVRSSDRVALGVDGNKVPISLGVGVDNLARKKGQNVGKVNFLEAVSQSGANFLLHGTAAGCESPLPVGPDEFIPKLRMDESLEKRLSRSSVLAEEAGKAINVLHPVHRFLYSLLRGDDFALRTNGPPLGGGEFLLYRKGHQLWYGTTEKGRVIVGRLVRFKGITSSTFDSIAFAFPCLLYARVIWRSVAEALPAGVSRATVVGIVGSVRSEGPLLAASLFAPRATLPRDWWEAVGTMTKPFSSTMAAKKEAVGLAKLNFALIMVP
nr:hypothetical protein Iba_chr09fCG12790 [Ipomoea batatas]